MIRYIFTLLTLLLPAVSWAQWTNEPAGSVTVADCAFSDSTFCNAQKGGLALNRFFDYYNSAAYEADAGDTISPSGTINAILPYTGPCSNGGSSFLACANGGMHFGYITSAPHREIFVGTNLWIPSGYGCSLVGASKWMFVRDLDNPAGFTPTNGVFVLRGCGATKQIVFSHNAGNHDNSHTCATDLGLTCFPNVGPGTITEGQWAKVEVCMRSSSSLTSRDGIVKWWVNGVPAGSYTNFNYGNGNINEVIYQQTWDGHGSGQGFQQTIRQRFGHLHISIPPSGGCASGSGGGSIDNPIGPPGTTTVTVTVQ